MFDYRVSYNYFSKPSNEITVFLFDAFVNKIKIYTSAIKWLLATDCFTPSFYIKA